VIVGKRALPALDLSTTYRASLRSLVRPEDIAIGFGPPEGDDDIASALLEARSLGALTVALPGDTGDYSVTAPSLDPFIHQEIVEILYHTLWETVHVFFERALIGHDGGPASFLYPFLGETAQPAAGVIPEVSESIRAKAACDERLRHQVAATEGDAMVAAALAIHERVAAGGTVYCIGNGGSATDATDLALDLVDSPKGQRRVAAVSLACEPATLTALANDIGVEALFQRQIIAHGRPGDVAWAISTSGGSSNIIAALVEARARGLLTIALVGYDGGEIRRRALADHVIVVESDQIPRVQEVQASIYHLVRDLVDAFGRGA
jgi:D-sedoheptulose 7-phosphate isomerase